MIPKSHPRYESLVLRDKIVKAQKEGYLADSANELHMGEEKHLTIFLVKKPHSPAKRAMYAAVATILLY